MSQRTGLDKSLAVSTKKRITSVSVKTCIICRPVPELTATRFANRYTYLTDHDKVLLRTWLVERAIFEDTIDGDTDDNENRNEKFVDNMLAQIMPVGKVVSKAKVADDMSGYSSSAFVRAWGDVLYEAIDARAYQLEWGPLHPQMKPILLPGPADVPSSTAYKTFRFMELPPELRLMVYREAMVPGIVRLRACKPFVDCIPRPSLTLGLLTTSKLVHHEAKDMIYENTFIADVVTDDTWNYFMPSQKLLPARILPRLTSLVLVVNLRSTTTYGCHAWM